MTTIEGNYLMGIMVWLAQTHSFVVWLYLSIFQDVFISSDDVKLGVHLSKSAVHWLKLYFSNMIATQKT
jgi:hypothetical protein